MLSEYRQQQQITIINKPTKKELQVLRILAKSKMLLSSREVEKQILGPEKIKEGKSDPDVYNVIKNKLCVQKLRHDFFLFDWNDLLCSINQEQGYTPTKIRIQRRVIDNLNSITLLGGLADYDPDRVNVSIEEHNSVIKIVAPKRHNNISINNKPQTYHSEIITLTIRKESNDYATLTKFDSNENIRQITTKPIPIPLVIRRVGKDELVFYVGFAEVPKVSALYLNNSLQEKPTQEIQRIKSMNPRSSEVFSSILKIQLNKRNWNYGINTRGLIWCILGIMSEEQEEENGRARNVEISNILENLSENYKEEFPFLIHYKEIKKLYNKKAEIQEKEDYKYFQVKILKQIAMKFQFDLDKIEMKELDYYITKQYREELEQYDTASHSLLSFITRPFDLPHVIRDYCIHAEKLIRSYLENELDGCRARLENHSHLLLQYPTTDDNDQIYRY
jgi:hypothetical protein